MSFLGKILIGVQMVLSILFMCAAGAVFVHHTSWQDKAALVDAEVASMDTEHADAVAEYERRIDELEQNLQTQTNRGDAEVGSNQQLDQQNASLTEEVNTLNQQLQRQTGLAGAKSNEASFRQEEAELVRVKYETLQGTVEDQVEVNRNLRDDIRVMEIAHEDLLAQYGELLEQVAFLDKVVRLNGLDTDRHAVADLTKPPPPVEGLVVETRKDKTNRTKFAHISIGKDDGIEVGHELDVFRSAERNDGKSQYLGRIRIVYTTPDEAVGTVVEAAKNGIIEKGDNVTTKL